MNKNRNQKSEVRSQNEEQLSPVSSDSRSLNSDFVNSSFLYVDSHAHIDGEEYDGDRDEVIERARAAGVRAILNVGTGDPHGGNLERAIKLAESYKDVYAAVGVHPHDARLFDASAKKHLAHLLRSSERIVALGEIGLDYHYDNSPRETQRAVFARQIQMAREMNLPVIIHTREAEEDTIEILRAEWSGAQNGAVMHCFSGSIEMAESVVEMNFMISFAGNITFKNAAPLRDVARQIPLDRLLIETDCPYLAPVPFRGRRNEPAHVIETARCLAGLHEMSVQEIGRITMANFARFCGLDILPRPDFQTGNAR